MLSNKTIFSDPTGNELRLSQVSNYVGRVAFNAFSIKYVVSGAEQYTINQKKHLVKKGEYVIGNSSTDSSIFIDNPNPVKGICVDVAAAKIREVIQYHFKETPAFDQFLFTGEFPVHQFKNKQTALGNVLATMACNFDTTLQTPETINEELFFVLAECIVRDQSSLYRQYAKLDACKPETNKRLFGSLWSAKEYLDANFQEKILVSEMAQIAHISEYHFIRLFKSVFDKTPHQYVMGNRLQFAKLLLQEGCDISQTAYQSGFADVQAFSKAFKTAFGQTPNHFKGSN